MKIRFITILLLASLLEGCGGSESPQGPRLSREPVSIRGWIREVTTAPQGNFKLLTGERERQAQIFRESYVSIENAPYASGGVAENGSFIILDVPPGDVTLTFQAPGIPNSQLQLKGLPPNGDVFLHAISLTPSAVQLLSPEKILVRIPGDKAVTKRAPHASETFVGISRARVIVAPLSEMSDRRDYPDPAAATNQ